MLRLAVDDALHGTTQTDNRDIYLTKCRQARAFLTTASDDLVAVCSNAGLEPLAVLELMHNLIAQASTPEEMHVQPRQLCDAVAKAMKKAKALSFKNRLYRLSGMARAAVDWCARIGITLKTLSNRQRLFWGPERSFTQSKAYGLLKRKVEARALHRATVQLIG